MKDYLLASAACFPALRAHTIDGVSYLDGGYRDNMPTALAQKMGAEELVCVDLEGVGITRPNRTGLPTTLIRSYWELGDILHFEPATARRNIELGYHDTLRAFGRLRGCAYAVDSGAESSADAAAFHAAFEAVQKDVREKHPSTLTADAALLLAKLSDAELAPLEAAAEDVGVDPAPTTPPVLWEKLSLQNATSSALGASSRCSRVKQARRRPRGPLCCPTPFCRHWSAGR